MFDRHKMMIWKKFPHFIYQQQLFWELQIQNMYRYLYGNIQSDARWPRKNGICSIFNFQISRYW